MTHKFDSRIHDLAVCKYSNFCFVYYLHCLHILDSSGWPGEKGQTFRKSTMLLGPGGFFTFLVVVAQGAPLQTQQILIIRGISFTFSIKLP